MAAGRNGAGLWPGRYGACNGRHGVRCRQQAARYSAYNCRRGFSAVPCPACFFGAERAACRQPIGWRLDAACWQHGIVPAIAGIGYRRRIRRRSVVPPIGGTVQPPYRAAQNGGGVAPAEWRVQRTPIGALSLPGLVAGPVSARQSPGGALSGGIPPDIMRGGAGAGPPSKGPAERCRQQAARFQAAGACGRRRKGERTGRVAPCFSGRSCGFRGLGARDRQACLWMGPSLWMR